MCLKIRVVCLLIQSKLLRTCAESSPPQAPQQATEGSMVANNLEGGFLHSNPCLAGMTLCERCKLLSQKISSWVTSAACGCCGSYIARHICPLQGECCLHQPGNLTLLGGLIFGQAFELLVEEGPVLGHQGIRVCKAGPGPPRCGQASLLQL